jgi:hypothetical protein
MTTPITAVQLRSAPRCELVHGEPHATLAGALGPVALFPPGAIVAYAVHAARPPRLFLFRTGAHLVAGAVLPGVHPRVQLLCALESERVLRRGRRFFAVLRRQGLHPSGLADAFYVRLERALRARGPLPRLALALLATRIHVHAKTPHAVSP